MTDLEYKNRSISSLVQQLNTLGNQQALTHQTQLIAIQNTPPKPLQWESQDLKIHRYQTKSSPQRQFFKLGQGQKKYYYDKVGPNLNQTVLKQFMKNWQIGYNCTILFQNNIGELTRLIRQLNEWIKECLVFILVVNNRNDVYDVLGQQKLLHRQLLQAKKYYQLDVDSLDPKMPIISQIQQYISAKQINPSQQKQQSFFIDITFKHPTLCNQLHLTLLPSQIFLPLQQSSPPFSMIKTQLLQLLNYIKINPNKRYQHISKLITKRLPLTNYLTKIFMSDSCNVVLNYISSNDEKKTINGDEKCQEFEKKIVFGKFQFFDKLSIVTNLLRKPKKQTIEIGLKKLVNTISKTDKSHQNPLNLPRSRQNDKASSRSKKIKSQVSPICKINMKTQNQYQYEKPDQEDSILKKQSELQRKQLQFCRSLERKTHKFSISPRQQQDNHCYNLQLKQNTSSNNNKTISKYQSLQQLHNIDTFQNDINQTNHQNMFAPISHQFGKSRNANGQIISESQQITLLKAQHSREISQYHQTIQLLNKKIMILTKQLNLEELYKVHERQIMLLELKIRQMRDDILTLNKQEPSEKATKSIIRKLTQEVKSYQTISTAKKISQGKFLMIEKQLKQAKQRLNLSQKARTALSLQVQALTKRLKIRDNQIQKINLDDLQKYQCQQLSVTEEQILEDVKKLVTAIRNQERNSAQFLLRKVSLILSDLSKSRDIILECNDFLVQLMEILDQKLNSRAPQIVLDCSKFIRSFLIENLSIF